MTIYDREVIDDDEELIKSGFWILVRKGYYSELFVCSNCGYINSTDGYFCPNCGAEMKEKP